MGRLVESTVVRSGGQLAAESGEGDTYLVRIAKYVPSEIVAGYVAINGFSLSAAEPQQLPIWIANFGLCLCLTPIYLARQASSGQPKAVHRSPSKRAAWKAR